MNKEKSRSPKKHEFLLNLAKSPPLSVDHFDFFSMHPHSKDSYTEEDDQVSLHHDRVATATDYLHSRNTQAHPSHSQGKKSHSKKKSVEHMKDTVTYLQSTPSSTKNAKALNKSSQSRTISRSNTAHHLNFLNSKEFAKFALSKVLPRDVKKEKAPKHLERSPQQKRSHTGSVEKSPVKNQSKEEVSTKYHMGQQSKKQKVKPRASNLTYNDFSSIVDQTRQATSFMNSPLKKSGVQISIPYTKSTSNLRPQSTKNSSQTIKNAWQVASNEAFKRLEGSRKQHGGGHTEESRSKERNKGMQSIASILNLKRDKKNSPEKKANSAYQSTNHRKVASIGHGAHGAQNSFNYIAANGQPVPLVSNLVSLQDDFKAGPLQRSPSQGKKTTNSPVKRDKSVGKTQESEYASGGNKGDQYATFQHTFEHLLDKYQCDMQNTQETYLMLKQAKYAYETFIKDLLAQLKNKKEPVAVSSNEKELALKCETLARDKGMLEEEIKYLRLENQRMYSMMSENRERNKDSGEVEGANETLKQIVMNQQNIIETLQNKEQKLMQLLYTIHQQGFDVEKLLREEANNEDYSEGEFIPSSNKRQTEENAERSSNNASQASGLEIYSLLTLGDMSDILSDYQGLKAKYAMSDAKTSDSTPYLGVNGLSNKLTAPMKDKLKLDFQGLPNGQKVGHQQMGFHDEFMARMPEMSISWQREALKLKNK